MSEIQPFTWHEEPPSSKHGEGVSRPRQSSKTREYRVIVYPVGAPPMTWITRAESKRHAVQYAEARWPGATAEVV